MPREPQKPPRAPTVPQDFPATPPPHSSGDYSYTVELVATMQHSLGKLTEAVESLKGQSKEDGKELKEIGKDIHAAKIVGGFIVAASGFLGFIVKMLVDYLKGR
jgi:hypothetical protein